MAMTKGQARQTLLTIQQQDHQQQKESYLPFLRSAVQPLRTVIPQVLAPLTANTNTVYTYNKLCQAETPASTSTKLFKALGSSQRGQNDLYIDVSELTDIVGQERQTIRGGVAEPSPQKFYSMPQDVEKQGKSNIVSFYSHGRAFAIHDMKAFREEIHRPLRNGTVLFLLLHCLRHISLSFIPATTWYW
jgi:hypothetical protein